ncbi:MAG TPA: Ig-like domain-containing protein, partial [Spirochaetia bacterium]|nr:Ig-like domain-containing protein [Spirochaetia bacterium]
MSDIRTFLLPSRFLVSGLACLALSLAAVSAFGQGYPFTNADGLENWDHDFDTSKLPAGTYHIVVQGKDNAGNSGMANSINVYIDPASALPVVSIINPTSLQRVGGDLTVVGTCVADAGISRVEVRIDDGQYQPAQGGDFWSLSIPTKDLPEGRKTLEVRGIDSAGLAGKPVRVVFVLDRTEPAASVDFPPPGSLVAGSIRLRGTALSMNGIASLEASTDNGKSFRNVSVERGKQPGKVSFTIDIDTRKFPDGPRIIWLRSVDRAGLKGSATFLVFVCNTKPKVDVRWPAPGDMVHGRFALAGSVRSAIGVAKLEYELEGGKKGDIALTPGDPYFIQGFDAREIKGDKANIVIVAQDKIGNITRHAVSAKIDHQAEKPAVKVIFPLPAAKLGLGDLVWGSIAADDGGAGIKVSVDGGAPRELPASDVFSFSLPSDVASGKHVITVQAKDAYGTWGNPVSLPVIVDGGAASVSFLKVVSGKGGTVGKGS